MDKLEGLYWLQGSDRGGFVTITKTLFSLYNVQIEDEGAHTLTHDRLKSIIDKWSKGGHIKKLDDFNKPSIKKHTFV
jgi:hypothetical protein